MSAFITDYSRTLAANESVLINCAGATSIRCLEGSAAFEIKPDDRNPVSMELGIGFKYRQSFDSLRIVNGATAQTIKLAIGDGDIEDNRMVGTVDISGGIVIAGSDAGGYGNVTVGVAASLVLAESSVRGSVLVQNLGGAEIYLGIDNSVTVSNGIKVDGNGGTMVLPMKTDIYAISAVAGQDVRYLYGEV
ncbi:MAG: hypothetical protein KZQ94_20915 [Candidatus Thiodiazotropha sp. (ex Troendleina suluensis)]|nr:hypothetical protein [Candidatus Thiodiazotropha sp. (ex Troendleina suluensis)]